MSWLPGLACSPQPLSMGNSELHSKLLPASFREKRPPPTTGNSCCFGADSFSPPCWSPFLRESQNRRSRVTWTLRMSRFQEKQNEFERCPVNHSRRCSQSGAPPESPSARLGQPDSGRPL